jgi:hypothetical protein
MSCNLIFAQNITIDPVAPPPDVTPSPQPGETDIYSKNKGIVQKASQSYLIINGKKYRISKYLKKKKMTKLSDLRDTSISIGSIVKFDLNKMGEIITIEKIHQLHSFCIVDRIDNSGIVCNDRYYKFSSNIKFYDSNGRTISRAFFKIHTKVGMELDQNRQLIGVWKFDHSTFH